MNRERRFAPASQLKKSAIDKYIGARMRESRLSLNISQEALAKAVGISFQQIQSYERGANGVSAVRLFEICKILNVSLSFMFQRDSKKWQHGTRSKGAKIQQQNSNPCQGRDALHFVTAMP